MSLGFFEKCGAAVRKKGELRLYLSVLLLIMILAAGCSGKAPEPVLEPYAGPDVSATDPDADSEPEPDVSATDPDADSEPDVSATDPDADSEPEPDVVTVHICGAVKHDGVYTLPKGSRLTDAVEAAGGFDKEADKEWLNLAVLLEDGWQIRVPTKKEADALRNGQEPLSPYTDGLTNSSGNSAASGNGAVSGGGTVYSGGAGVPGPGSGAGEKADTAGKININTASREELTSLPGIGPGKAQNILDYREQNGQFASIKELMKVPGIKKASFEKIRDLVTVQ